MASRKDATEALRCDICLRKDGWTGLCIQKCSSCGVCVHEECYGLFETKKKQSNWKCWACQAVGKEIQGSTLNGKLKTIRQEERAKECVLCAVNDGVHAMHALYSDHGPNGRQAILPAGGDLCQRLAWVHSLCALTVCRLEGTRGSVYGCDAEGDWEGNEPVQHFVMCGLNGDTKEDELYIKMLEEHRSLTCIICGEHEKSAGRKLRVPVQCCAGDDDEFSEFKQFHSSILEPCTQAMHPGCAMWGPPRPRNRHARRCFFYPGSAIEGAGAHEDPVAQVFCNLHAKQMGATMSGIKKGRAQIKSGGGVLQYAHADSSKPSGAADVLPTYTSPSVERRASYSAGEATAAPRRKEHFSSLVGTKKKHGSKAQSTTKEVPLRRQSDSVMKSARPSKDKPTLSTTRKPVSTSDNVKAKPPTTTKSPSPLPSAIPRKNRNTSSPTETKSGETSVAIPRKSSHITPPATNDTSNKAMESAKQAAATSSVSQKGTRPLTATAQLNEGKDPKPGLQSTPSPLKRRRFRSISEEKMPDKNDSAAIGKSLDGVRRTIASESNRDSETNDHVWMSDDAQGLVETDELPPITTVPEGDNPWAYLWEPGAPPFKLELIASAERRNVKGAVETAFSNEK